MCFSGLFVLRCHVWYLVKMDGEKNHRRKRKRTFISIFYIYIYVHVGIFFSIRVFFHGHWRLTWQQGKRGDHFLFQSTTSTLSQTLRHLLATLDVRWLSHVFNRTACIYQTANRWDLPPYRNIIWLIDDAKLVFVSFTWRFNTTFLLQQSWYGKPVESNSHRLSPSYLKGTNTGI